MTLDWDIGYPLGATAVHIVFGQDRLACAQLKVLIGRELIDLDTVDLRVVEQAYRVEATLLTGRNKPPHTDLEALWVADRAQKKPGLVEPALYVYSLKKCLDFLEERDSENV